MRAFLGLRPANISTVISEIPMKDLISGAGPEAVYFSKLAEGVWSIQRCSACQTHIFTPRLHCPDCESDQLEWVQPSGKGVVYAYTVVRLKPEQPYNVALIDLQEGVRMMSRVVDVAPSDIRIGMKVKALIEGGGEQARVVFAPEGA